MDFERLIATLNNYIIVASVIVIAIRKSINCAALCWMIKQVKNSNIEKGMQAIARARISYRLYTKTGRIKMLS